MIYSLGTLTGLYQDAVQGVRADPFQEDHRGTANSSCRSLMGCPT
jgi:hypothetical protein